MIAASPAAAIGASPEGEARLGPYRLVRKLGQGGFAPVWLGEEIHDGRKLREVAVKIFERPVEIAPGSAEAARWREGILEEAHALCRIEHPGVVRFHALARDDEAGLVGLVMELVAGQSLAERLQREGRLDLGAVVDAGIDVAWALSAVHGAGLVHRDVKPANVIQGPSGYKLVDFGIVGAAPPPSQARVSSAAGALEATEAGSIETTGGPVRIAGTPGYIAPECLAGAPASPSSDLYALGVMLFKLATGVRPDDPGVAPSTREIFAAAAAGRSSAPRLDASLPDGTPGARALADLVVQLLAEERRVRPRHAAWVARELTRIRADRPAIPSTAGPSSRPTVDDPSSERSATPAIEPTLREALSLEPTIGEATIEPGELRRHPALVGRDEALAAVARACAEAEAGRVRFVLVTGPLGIGRTRLLDAAADRDGEGIVLRAGCSPERQSPLRPLGRALDPPPPGLRAVAEAIGRILAPSPLGGSPAGDALEGVEDALLAASASTPVILVVDDLQWGDAPTLGLLRLLVERASAGARGRLAVIAAARNEPSPSPPLRALLGAVRGRSHAGVRHLALGPLSPEDAAALASEALPVEPAIAEAVARGAGGVPFFVIHALSALRDRGAIAWSDGAWRAPDPRALDGEIPGVAELLEARVNACFDPAGPLARAALRALGAVALHGGGLGVEVLLPLAGDEDSAERALDALVEEGILTVSAPRQEYGFAQEMVRLAALNLVSRRPWLRRLHRALLDAVAAGEGPDAAFLAAGYEALGERAPARRWLEQAMRAAISAGLFAEAAELGDRLAAIEDGPGARAEAELAVVGALVQGRLFEEARGRLDRLAARAQVLAPESAALDVRRRILALETARGLGEVDRDDPSLLAAADALGSAAIACQARLALAGVAPEDRALGLTGEAVELGRRAGPALELAARTLRFEINYGANRPDLALAEADLTRALAIAAAAGTLFQQVHIEGDLAAIEAERGRPGEAIARLRGLCEKAAALGMRGQLRLFLQNLGALLLRVGGDAEAALVAARTTALAAEAGDPVLQATSMSLRAEALRRAGDLPAALGSASEAERIQRERDDRMRALTLLRRAEILAALGRSAEALSDAREARAVAERHGDRDLGLGAQLWEALHLARRDEAPRAILERAVAEARGAGVTLRALTRGLLESAEAWLAGATGG